MNTVAIIQARMGSSRLPKKVMMPLASRPMIHHVVERARRIPGVDKVVLATSTSELDDPLVDYAQSQLNVPVVRGPEDDVLYRYVMAATEHNADPIMRITGDCPLLSPRISGLVLGAYLNRQEYCDYATNTLRRTFPRGLDTEVFSYGALLRAHQRGLSEAEREHVTLAIHSAPRAFRLLGVTSSDNPPLYRWTVDTREDYELVSRLFALLYTRDPHFEFEDVLKAMDEHPQWIEFNQEVRQKSPGPTEQRFGSHFGGA